MLPLFSPHVVGVGVAITDIGLGGLSVTDVVPEHEVPVRVTVTVYVSGGTFVGVRVLGSPPD